MKVKIKKFGFLFFNMNKKIVACCLLVSLLSVGAVLAAKPADKTFNIPNSAKEVAPGVFRLGYSIDNGRFVEGYAFVRYKKGFVKPGTVCGNGVCEPSENVNKCPEDCGNGGGDEPDTSSCYSFLSRGAKWKVVEPYIVDATNNGGLNEGYVSTNMASDIAKWEAAAEADILGDEVVDVVDGADTDSTDGKNEVMFGDISEPGVIGVAIVWGIFGGPPPWRELVEWDMIFDDADFDWSEDCLADNCSKQMDFENIATHELGHSVGMGDLYDSVCSEETMYGYASYGETKKRDLNAGDINGVNKLYA